MSEKKFKIRLKGAFEKFCEEEGANFDWQLHEDGMSVGIPDISGSMHLVNSISFWIEAKYSNRVFRPENKYDEKFEKNQESWLMRREWAGTACFLFHEYSNGTLVVRATAFPYTLVGQRTNECFLKTGEARFYEGGFKKSDVPNFFSAVLYKRPL